MPDPEPQAERAEWSFATLLAWHLDRGTRPNGSPDRPGKPWGNKEFADALGNNERSVRNWRSGRVVPADIGSIERVLFGDNLHFDGWRLELRLAHTKAGAKETAETPSGRVDTPPRQPRNLPYASLGLLFMGRDAFMASLRAVLTKAGAGHAAAVTGKALHGLGGVGKTRLAIEYAWRNAESYSALLFVPAGTPQQLDASLAALAGPDILDLPEKDAREDAVKISAALHWLDCHPGWLMILDNVDDRPSAVAAEALLARLKGGHVLITGRMSNFSAAVQKLQLDVLAETDSGDFLMARTADKRAPAQDDATQALALAKELGGLALALEQAGAYIEHQRIGFDRYLKLWRDNRPKVLGWFDPHLTSYNHDVGLAATWLTSVAQLTESGRILLERLAFLAPEPIPDSLLDVAVPGEEASFDSRKALTDLYAYSLATRAQVVAGKAAQPGFQVHRLVQDFTARGMADDRRRVRLREALAWLDAAVVGDAQDVRSWPVLDPLAPHALAIATNGDEASIAAPTSRVMNQVGGLFHQKARHKEAEPLYRRALAIDEASLGPDHSGVAIRLNNLAQLLMATNRLAEAEPLMRRALAIDEASLGPDHPEVAIRLNNLAGLLQSTNRLAEAEPLYRRALAIDEASLGPDHPNVAIRLNNLAGLCHDTNRLAEAEPLVRRALAIDEASFGPDHPRVATDLNNLAQLLQATNRLVEAEPLMRRALAIDEASFGPDHPEVARDLSNLAELLRATSRLAEAELLMRRALAIHEASLGPDHPNVARDLNNLAELLRATSRLAEAEPLMRRALAIDEASLGLDHPNVAIRLNNLSLLLHATNRLAEAEPLMRRALAIDEASFGLGHPRVAITLNNLAKLLQDTDRLVQAEPLSLRHLSIFLAFTASTGHGHPHLLTALGNYFGLLTAMGLSEAEAEAAIDALAKEHGLKIAARH